MFGTVATTKIKEGKNADFEKVATELVKKVNENEKGTPIRQRSMPISAQNISSHSWGRWLNSWTVSRLSTR